MRKFTLLALLTLGLSTVAIAQYAAQHQNRAASLFLSGEHDAACAELKLAAQLYRSEKEWMPFFSCLTQLTQAYLSANDLAKAKKTAKDALWQSINLLGRNNNEAAKAAHQLAQVYAAAGRFEDAMQYHEMGLDIRTDMHGQFHPTVSESYVHIAGTCREAGLLDQAQQHLAKALSIIQANYREEHPETVPVLLQMGKLQAIMGKPDKAKSTYRRAVAIQRKAGMAGADKLIHALVKLAELSPPAERAAHYREAAGLIDELGLESGRFVGAVQLFLAEAAADEADFEEALDKGRAAVRAFSLLPASDTAKVRALQLCARAARLLGLLETSLRFYEHLIPLGAGGHLEAAEAALLAGRYQQAVRWSAPLAKINTQKWDGRAALLQAEALLQLNRLEEAGRVLNTVDRQSAPAHLVSRAHYLAAELAMAEKAYEQSMEQLESGLALLPEDDHFTSLQLHAASGILYGLLARQDRNALHNLQQSMAAFEQYQRSLSNLLKNRPLEATERRWLEENHKKIYGHALGSCFLMYQQQQEEATLASAFRYMELAKQLALDLERDYWKPAALDQKRRYLRLEGVAKTDPSYEKGAEKEDAIALVSMRAFQSLLRQQAAQALCYYVGEEHLYVLQLTPEKSLLLRKDWSQSSREVLASFVRSGTADHYRQEGAPSSALLLPSMSRGDVWRKLLVFPAAELLAFPFAALPAGDQLLGQVYELHNDISCSAYVTHSKRKKEAYGAEAPKVGLLPEAFHRGSEALVLPTTGGVNSSCQPSVLSWIQKGGGHILSLQQWMEERPRAVSVLAMPEWQVDSLVAALPDQAFFANQLLLAEPVPKSERPGALLYAISAWQESNAQQIVLYPDLCHEENTLQPLLSAWEQTGDIAKRLFDLRQQIPADKKHLAWRMQIYGAPTLAAPQHNNIPITWILCTIGGLVLLGWWVKR